MVKVLNYEVCQQDSQETVRVLSILSALIMCLIGVAIVYLGMLKYEVFSKVAEAIGEKYMLVALTVIAVGILAALVAFIGILALLLMGYNLVMAYFYFAMFIFMVQAVFGSFLLLDGQDACSMKRSLSNSMSAYAMNSTDRSALDYLESRMQCCGVLTPWDYTSCVVDSSGVVTPGPDGALPASCCQGGQVCWLGDGRHWSRGCVDQAAHFVYTSTHRMGTVLVCAATIAALSAALVYVHAMNLRMTFTVL